MANDSPPKNDKSDICVKVAELLEMEFPQARAAFLGLAACTDIMPDFTVTAFPEFVDRLRLALTADNEKDSARHLTAAQDRLDRVTKEAYECILDLLLGRIDKLNSQYMRSIVKNLPLTDIPRVEDVAIRLKRIDRHDGVPAIEAAQQLLEDLDAAVRKIADVRRKIAFFVLAVLLAALLPGVFAWTLRQVSSLFAL